MTNQPCSTHTYSGNPSSVSRRYRSWRRQRGQLSGIGYSDAILRFYVGALPAEVPSGKKSPASTMFRRAFSCHSPTHFLRTSVTLILIPLSLCAADSNVAHACLSDTNRKCAR
jgi:hypothetical protein